MIDFLVLPTFQLTTLSLAIEMLRLLNRAAKDRLIRWRVIADGHKAVSASNGLSVNITHDIKDISDSEILFVCASFDIDVHYSESIGAKLRRLSRSGTILGGLDTGAFVLARAGLLKNKKVTLHWESIPLFIETYPDINVTYDLFDVDNKIITSPGNIATFDLFFHLIEGWFGSELAQSISNLMIREPYGALRAEQRPFVDQDINLSDSRLRAAIAIMNGTVDEPVPLANIAHRVGVSERHLARLFQRFTGRSPYRFYFELRLQYAKRLLAGSNLKIVDVAVACGFKSLSAFSHAFKKAFGVAPNSARHYNVGSDIIRGPRQ